MWDGKGELVRWERRGSVQRDDHVAYVRALITVQHAKNDGAQLVED
jgi:hypothetical protein